MSKTVRMILFIVALIALWKLGVLQFLFNVVVGIIAFCVIVAVALWGLLFDFKMPGKKDDAGTSNAPKT